MDLLLARVVFGIHLSIVLWLTVVWSLPWSWAWWTAMIGNPIVQLNWWIFGNRCVLSVLEERLRERAGRRAIGEADREPLEFVSHLMSSVLGRPVSRSWGSRVSYSVLWGGFAIAAMRLAAQRP